jgi:hypothetical protein
VNPKSCITQNFSGGYRLSTAQLTNQRRIIVEAESGGTDMLGLFTLKLIATVLAIEVAILKGFGALTSARRRGESTPRRGRRRIDA